MLALFQLSALQTWTARTATGPLLVHFLMSWLFPCLRTGSTGRTGTCTLWRRLISTQEKSELLWATIHTSPLIFMSATPTGNLEVCKFELFLSYEPSAHNLPICHLSLITFLGENPCSSHDLTCSHLCLIAPGGQRATCECPDHFIGLAVGFKIQCVADCSSTQFRCGDNERSVRSIHLVSPSIYKH